MKNKKSHLLFSSFQGQLYFVISLLVLIFIVILLNVYAGRFVDQTVQEYSKVVELESRFLHLASQEERSLKTEENFSAMMKKYSALHTACSRCHQGKNRGLVERGNILRGLRGGLRELLTLKRYVFKRLKEQAGGVRYIHEHHIAALKNISRRSGQRNTIDPDVDEFEKSSTRSAPELDIIKQIVLIQQAIGDLTNNFYSLTQGSDLEEVKQGFARNLAAFYEAVNTFEDYSLDAQDGMLVEELLDNWRVFQRSLDGLVKLIGKQHDLHLQLDKNRLTIIASLSSGKQKLLVNGEQLSQRINLLKLSTIVIVFLLFVAGFLRSRRIILSINRVVRETGKIERDFRYRIEDDPSIVSEFQILTNALNSMAGKIESRVQNLSEELEQRIVVEEKLSMEKERLAVTLRSIGDGVITADTKGRIVLLNKVAEQLTGWRQEEAEGKPIGHVFNIHNGETGEPCPSPVYEVIRQGRSVELADNIKLTVRDGGALSIADSGAPIRDVDNKIIGVVLVFRDVTERLRMEQELQKVEKMESLSVLASGIAHDFNNILLVILGNINLACRYIDQGNKASKLLVDAEKAANTAQGLTQQLLMFSQGGNLVKKAVSVKRLIKDSAGFVLHGSEVSCKYHFVDDLWLVDIDEGQMSQVIQNVTLNAKHAMPDGGEIMIECENIVDIYQETSLIKPQKVYVKIKISDQGKGIGSKDLEKIFDPYFTTKKGGSGLGLAVSHSIIQKHNGFIRVESEPDEGTVVTIYLPAVQGRRHEPSRKKEVRTDCKGKIMVMDDDDMVLRITGDMLLHMGYDVVLVEDGVSAVKKYEELMKSKSPIDIVLMDLTISGGMGGKEAVREILRLDRDARVIVSSGYSNDTVFIRYEDYGFCGAIVKPYDLANISRVLKEAQEI